MISMWIASKYGWFSLVKKDGGYHVRARDENDLRLLQAAVGGDFAGLQIHLTPSADYCSRVFVPEEGSKEIITSIMATLGESVDYANFKSMIAASPEQRDKLHSYHGVWARMDEYQSMKLHP
jgi:hypothetical protein